MPALLMLFLSLPGTENMLMCLLFARPLLGALVCFKNSVTLAPFKTCGTRLVLVTSFMFSLETQLFHI